MNFLSMLASFFFEMAAWAGAVFAAAILIVRIVLEIRHGGPKTALLPAPVGARVPEAAAGTRK